MTNVIDLKDAIKRHILGVYSPKQLVTVASTLEANGIRPKNMPIAPGQSFQTVLSFVIKGREEKTFWFNHANTSKEGELISKVYYSDDDFEFEVFND